MRTRSLSCAAMLLASLFTGPSALAQTDLLGSVDQLDLVNVKAEVAEYQGKRAIRVTGTRQQGAPDIRGGQRPGGAGAAPRQRGPAQQGAGRGPGQPGRAAGGPGGRGPRGPRAESLAIVKGTDFTNGTIEVELAGRPNENAGANARGFIGIAFHVEKSDPIAYDCFYLRPTNGRADDQLRRNHTCQYMSHPDFPFNLLRRETPGVYESYVDLAPGEWTQVKIVVQEEKAQLYVNGADQPCLIVNDVKRAGKTGAIALWQEQSTDAYFRNLVVTAGK